MSFSLFSGDDESVPGAEQERPLEGSSRPSALPLPRKSERAPNEAPPESGNENGDGEAIPLTRPSGLAPPPLPRDLGAGVPEADDAPVIEVSSDDVELDDDAILALAGEDLFDGPDDFNAQIRDWVRTTAPPPVEAEARLDAASDRALAELEAEASVDETAARALETTTPAQRTGDGAQRTGDGAQRTGDGKEPIAQPPVAEAAARANELADRDEPVDMATSKPPPSSDRLSDEPPSLRSLALASLPPLELAERGASPGSGDSAVIMSSSLFSAHDVSAPPPSSFFEVPAETAIPALEASADGSLRAPPPRRRRAASSTPGDGEAQAADNTLSVSTPPPLPVARKAPPAQRDARVAPSHSIQPGTREPEKQAPRDAEGHVSPLLTHLAAFVLGVLATMVVVDVLSGDAPVAPGSERVPAAAERSVPGSRRALDDPAAGSHTDPAADVEGSDPQSPPTQPEQDGVLAAGDATAGVPSSATALAPTEPTSEPSAALSAISSEASGEPPPFDTGAARAALGGLAASAASCGDGALKGSSRVAVTFAKSGKATVALIDGPLSGTSVGSCIANIMRSAKVPAYTGDTVTVRTTVTVR